MLLRFFALLLVYQAKLFVNAYSFFRFSDVALEQKRRFNGSAVEYSFSCFVRLSVRLAVRRDLLV